MAVLDISKSPAHLTTGYYLRPDVGQQITGNPPTMSERASHLAHCLRAANKLGSQLANKPVCKELQLANTSKLPGAGSSPPATDAVEGAVVVKYPQVTI